MKRYSKKIFVAILWACIAGLFFSDRADGHWFAAMSLVGAAISLAVFAGPDRKSLRLPLILAAISISSFWLYFTGRMDVHWLATIHLLGMSLVAVLIGGQKTNKLNGPLLLTALFLGLAWLSYQESINLYIQTVLMFMGINIIMSTSLNLVNGYMGEFNCGHAGPMAVGAYVSSLLSVWWFTKSTVFGDALFSPEYALYLFPACLLAGMLAAAVVGFCIAVPSFKTRGDYLAIITIAINYIIKSTIENINVIGGARGFMGMGKVTSAMDLAPQAFGLDTTWDLPWMVMWVFLGTVFSVWLLRRFISSTYGKGIIAICQDEIAAEIMSVNTNRMKIVAFMLSSALAGLAGGLMAHVIGYVNPGSFTVLKSTEALLMVYLAGMGSLSGAVIAAVLYTLLLEALRFVIPVIDSGLHWIQIIPDGYEVSQVWKWVIIPLLLVLIMHKKPEGLMGNRELPDFYPGLKKYYQFK
jgi:branched-chain amino acid transport system permease protein